MTATLIQQVENTLADIEAAREDYDAGKTEVERLSDPALGTGAHGQEGSGLEFAETRRSAAHRRRSAPGHCDRQPPRSTSGTRSRAR